MVDNSDGTVGGYITVTAIHLLNEPTTYGKTSSIEWSFNVAQRKKVGVSILVDGKMEFFDSLPKRICLLFIVFTSNRQTR